MDELKMRLEDVVISEDFLAHQPSQEKVTRKKNYFLTNGVQDKTIVVGFEEAYKGKNSAVFKLSRDYEKKSVNI